MGVGYSSIGNGWIIGEYTPDGGYDGTFVIGEYYSSLYEGGGAPAGVGFSAIGEGWTIAGIVGDDEYSYAGSGFTVGTATIGSTFVIGVYTSQPLINPANNYNYRTHKSNVLLGNAQIGRKSKKYFSYHTYETEGSSVIVG